MTAKALELQDKTAYGAADELRPVRPSGWRSGVSNLMRKETHTWLRTRYGLIQLVLWIVIVNGLMALIISDSGSGLEEGDTAMAESVRSYIQLISWFTPIGVAALAMGAIIGEKSSGTAAWTLSAPVSRSGFLLSKLGALTVGIIATMIVIPGVITFFELSNIPASADTGDVAVLPWITANGALALNLVFFASLSIALGTLFNSRGAVIGIPLAVVFFGLFFGGALPEFLLNLTPWGLTRQTAVQLALESEVAISVVPAIATVGWIILFTGISFWRFQREEL